MFAQGQSSTNMYRPTGATLSPGAEYNPVNFSPNVNASGNDDTLQRIYSAANEDVEMKDDFFAALYLVLDTNVLIDHLDVIKRFNDDIERLRMPITIIIPSVLLSELDGLKKRESIGWFASRASAWILNKMKERRTVHVQARRETCGIDIRSYEVAHRNDTYIYDCCQFFARRGHVIFVSSDLNLHSTVDSINTDSVGRAELFADIVMILPDRKGWSSRALARKLADSGVKITGLQVEDRDPKYQRSRNTEEGRVIVLDQADDGDEDMMEVDDLSGQPEDNNAKVHALDALHFQVVDHFTLLLKDLAQRVRIQDGDTATDGSDHAPEYRRKEFSMWTVGDCLAYLSRKKRLPDCQPPLERFLRHPEPRQGTRKGKEWAKQQWVNVAAALAEIGAKWEDGAILGSVEYLRQETDTAFLIQPPSSSSSTQ